MVRMLYSMMAIMLALVASGAGCNAAEVKGSRKVTADSRAESAFATRQLQPLERKKQVLEQRIQQLEAGGGKADPRTNKEYLSLQRQLVATEKSIVALETAEYRRDTAPKRSWNKNESLAERKELERDRRQLLEDERVLPRKGKSLGNPSAKIPSPPKPGPSSPGVIAGVGGSGPSNKPAATPSVPKSAAMDHLTGDGLLQTRLKVSKGTDAKGPSAAARFGAGNAPTVSTMTTPKPFPRLESIPNLGKIH